MIAACAVYGGSKLYFCEIQADGAKEETLEWAQNAQAARWAVESLYAGSENVSVKARVALPFHLDRLREQGCEIPEIEL